MNTTVTYAIPQISNTTPLTINIENGTPLFIVGQNGSGKSSLMHFLYTKNKENTKRILSHRQNWFNHINLDLSKSNVSRHSEWINHFDDTYDSRWRDEYAQTRPNITAFKLIESENSYARKLANVAKSENKEEYQKIINEKTNLEKINQLLIDSNFQVQLSINDDGDLVAARHNTSEKYSIAMLSDGERNALLIAADVLNAPNDTTILIDEPERHIHKSITTPFLTQLIDLRKDCKFIISTHEISLPYEIKDSHVIVVQDCLYEKNSSSYNVMWEVKYIQDPKHIDESVVTDILGTRKKVIFIEGEIRSLDYPLYSLIFPNISIIAKRTCREVMHSVCGINDAGNLHHTHAFGLIDNDRRPAEKISELASKNIFSLTAYSVESIYYNQNIFKILAKKQSELNGYDLNEILASAKDKFLSSIQQSKEDLCIRSVEKSLQTEIDSKNIKRREIKTTEQFLIEISVKEKLNTEIQTLETKIAEKDYQYIVDNYPVRSSTALDACTKEIGFQGKEQYEKAVIKLLSESDEARQIVQQILAPLFEAVTQN